MKPFPALLIPGFAAAVATPPPQRSCSNIPTPQLHGANILSLTTAALTNHTVEASPPLLNTPVSGVNVCEVNVTVTHPGANDTVLIQVWLPLEPATKWNGRLISLGGSAWAAGHGPLSMASYAVQGFAAASTDAGLSAAGASPFNPGPWALKPDGTVNKELLTNFASRSIHDLAVVAKAVTTSYYRREVRFSYWNGCSTGGRQGMVAAQQYPADFDGILAGSPAIYWTKYVIAELWPQVVMKEEGYYPSACEFAAVRNDAVAACDELDGVKDGVISDLVRCKAKYEPARLVGKTLNCSGTDIIITSKLVSIVKRVWEGPLQVDGSALWYGLNIGAPLDTLGGVVNGTGAPFFVASDWVRYFVKANPNFDVSSLDTTTLGQVFAESVDMFAHLIDSSNPNLSGFKKAGGKLLVWHGEADPVIFPQDSVQYHNEVQQTMGHKEIDPFFRLFIAPGVDHCAQGTIDGAGPTDPLGVLIDWVEKGKAPNEMLGETLTTAKTHFTRKLCAYPAVAKYDGLGDPSVAESYFCEKRHGW